MEVTHFCVRSSHLRPIPRRQTFYCECICVWLTYRMIQHETSNILQAHCQHKCSKQLRNGAAADLTKHATINTPENRDAQGRPCFLQLLVEHLVLQRVCGRVCAFNVALDRIMHTRQARCTLDRLGAHSTWSMGTRQARCTLDKFDAH